MVLPLFNTDAPVAPLREALVGRIADVVRGGTFILGPEVREFEREFASYLGVEHVVGVANGTDALEIALRALGVKAGDDVVVPSLTFYATAEAVASIGARPVFCDVDADTRNVTVETVRAALTPATTAIIAVDLCGVPAPIPALAQLGLPVLEDAAQAAGATLAGRRTGSLGHAATFSFYPSKNLACFGDGGAIATDDEQVAELARALRFHGSYDKQTFTYVGYNSRLDELQAAVLRVLLGHLDEWTMGRRAAASAYVSEGLGSHVTLPVAPPEAEPAWHLYLVTHPRADALLAELHRRGIEARAYYRTPLHRQPAMAPFGAAAARLPVTDELGATNIALPMSPVLSPDEVREVVAAVAAGAAVVAP